MADDDMDARGRRELMVCSRAARICSALFARSAIVIQAPIISVASNLEVKGSASGPLHEPLAMEFLVSPSRIAIPLTVLRKGLVLCSGLLGMPAGKFTRWIASSMSSRLKCATISVRIGDRLLVVLGFIEVGLHPLPHGEPLAQLFCGDELHHEPFCGQVRLLCPSFPQRLHFCGARVRIIRLFAGTPVSCSNSSSRARRAPE